MSYLGNQPTSAAFLTDQFSGNGSTTTFTLSTAPAGTTSILVSVSGVLQDPTTYSVVGTTLTLGGAAPTGTGNISVRYLGIPASGVVTTAYRTVTEFTATAGQTTFTPPSYSVGFIAVYLNGARLGAGDFTASNGTTIVLATGASVDDLVVTESFYISSVANAIPNIPGAVTETNLVSTILQPASISDKDNTSTGYFDLPAGTTAQRPASPAGGMTRYNTTNSEVEIYTNGSWQGVTTQIAGTYSIDYLIVAGGGAGGQNLGSSTYASAGGGAGGLLQGISTVSKNTAYSLVIGAGAGAAGYAGNNSTGLSLTAIGGGSGSPNNGASTRNGGSGGGAGDPPATDSQPAGSGTAGQGNSGGAAPGGQGTSGGGGGAGATGSGAQGGVGISWQSLGAFYAGGGSGTNGGSLVGGGQGGGGTGGPFANSTAGTVNTGGGGGGSYGGSGSQAGKTGGSGIIILRYVGSQRGSGGTITSAGGYTYHTFTSSGTYTA
jgi:hypothetical protein